MNEVILFFIGLNFIILAWVFIWKKSLLEKVIDNLFNLRDQTRKYCIEKNIPLDDVAYLNYRNLLNGHIKFVDEVTLFRIIFFNSQISNNDDIYKYMEKKIDKLFKSENKELTEYIEKSREKAILHIMEYLILSSFLLSCVTAISIIVLFIKELFSFSIKKTNDLWHVSSKFIEETLFENDKIEELSYYSRKDDPLPIKC